MELTGHRCPRCGAELEKNGGNGWKCKYCGGTFDDATAEKNAKQMQDLFDEAKRERINNIRRVLYDATTAEYISSNDIKNACDELKKYLPDDFRANFYEIAVGNNLKKLTSAIRKIDVEQNYDEIENIVVFLIKSLQSEYLLELNNLVERAYKGRDLQKFEKYATEISVQAEKVQAGVYETKLPREVFVAYSSKDMEKVSELVEVLESQNIKCFVAARNLRHGRGSVENYDKALKDAMDHCKSFVFVSSMNSRSLSCDALEIEIPYIQKQDIENAPPEYRNNYTAIPHKYKKPRVEYRIEGSKGFNAADQITGEFFDGYEWVLSPDEVAVRVLKQLVATPGTESEPSRKTVSNKKYCVSCGNETEKSQKFCSNCGKAEFVDDIGEFIKIKNQRDMEERRRREEAERRQEEERRRREDEERKKAAYQNIYSNNASSSHSTYKPSNTTVNSSTNNKSKVVAVLLAFFLGSLGIDQFYLGYTKRGVWRIVLSFLSCGIISGIWSLIDCFRIASGSLPLDPGVKPVKKKTGCLKTVIILAVIVVIVLIFLAIIDNQLSLGIFDDNGTTGNDWNGAETVEEATDPINSDSESEYIGTYDLSIPEIQVVSGIIMVEYDSGYTENLVFEINGKEYIEEPIKEYKLPDSFDAGTYTVKVKAVNKNEFVNDSDYSDSITVTKLQAICLGNISNGILSFEASSESDLYDVYVDGEYYKSITGNEFDLNSVDRAGQHSVTIAVKPTETMQLYSNQSEAVSYTRLSNNVSFSVDSGCLTWAPISKATGYEFYVSGRLVSTYGTDIPSLDIMSFYSEAGFASFTVKVLGDGTEYINSSISSVYEYTFTDKYVPLRTVDDLYKLNNSDERFILTNDIDLSSVSNWTPIENFSGYFFGNNKAIKNLTINTNGSNIGFFSNLSGTVDNLNFENANIMVSGSNENIGVLCGSMQGTASNVTVSGIVKADDSKNVGGIIGYYNKCGNSSMMRLIGSVNVSGDSRVGGVVGACNVSTRNYSNYTVTMESLENSGSVKASGDYAGGLFGFLSYDEGNSYTVTMSGLKNTGDISGQLYVGGLIGYGSTDNNSSYIKNSSSSATITAEAYAGCIAGKLSSIRIDSCSNEGSTLTATKYVTDAGEKYAYVGGYVGRGYLISNCTNAVEINYTSDGKYIGGIMGYTDAAGSTEMQNLKNTANISGSGYVGGIIGAQSVSTRNYSNYTVSLEEFENSGKIVGSSDYVGGIYGYMGFDEGNSYTVYISEFKNTGDVSGKTYVGGLLGYGVTDNNASYIKDSANQSIIKAEAYVGCIAGRLSAIKLDSCTNDGSTLEATKYITDSGEKYAFVGGFVGRGYLASNCSNAVIIDYRSDGKYVGGIMGYTDAAGSTEMEYLKNSAAISGKEYVGGIVGCWAVSTRNYSNYTVTLDEFENIGKISGTSNYVGGVFGYMSFDEGNSYTVYMTEFKNEGDISGKNYVGGLIGYGATDNNSSYIKDSSSSSAITAEAYVGCIAGRLVAVAIDNCTNDGSSISATKYITESDTKFAYLGGFVGRGYLVSNCTNKVNINYSSDGRYVGGIMGYTDASGSTSMSNLKNEASIKGKDYVGGIIGSWNVSTRNYSNYTVNVDSFDNTGSVTGTGDYVGGLFGHMYFNEGNSYTVFMTELHNSANISGNAYVGGLIGYGETDSDKSSLVDSASTGTVNGTSNYDKVAGKLVKISA